MSDVAPSVVAGPSLYHTTGPDDPTRPKDLAGWVNDRIIPTIAGAGNSLALGIPQAVVSQFNPKGVENYVASHPAYSGGGVIGDVASMAFNPLKMLGKAAIAGSKLLPSGEKIIEKVLPKSAADFVVDSSGVASKPTEQIIKESTEIPNGLKKLGLGMQNLGSATGLAAIPGQAINNAIQQGIRSAAGNDPDAGKHILEASAIGGIGGVLTAGLGGLSKLTKEAEKLATKSTLAGMELQQRRVFTDFMKNSGNGSALSKVGKPEDFLNNLADVKTKYKLTGGPSDDEKLLEAYKQKKSEWEELDNLATTNPDFVHKTVFDAADDVDKSIQNTFKFGSKPQQGLVEDMYQGMANEPNLAAKRQYLQQIIDQNKNIHNWTPGIEGRTSQASFMAAVGMREALDNAVSDLAKQAGRSNLLQSAKEWGPLQTLASGNLRDQLRLPKESTGSPTAEKLFTDSLLRGKEGGFVEGLVRNGASSLAGAAATHFIPKILNKAAGLVRNPLKRFNAAGENSGAFNALQNIAPQAGAASRLGGSLLANAEAEQYNQDNPLDSSSQETTATGEVKEPVQDTQNYQALENGIETLWNEQYGKLYGPPNPSDTKFQQFAQGVVRYLTHNGTAPVDMRLAAGIMFPDADDKKSYLKAFESIEKVKSLFPTASKSFLLSGLDSPQVTAANNALRDVYAEAVGGDKSGAYTAYDGIMKSSYNPQQKMKLLFDTMSKSDPRAHELLKQAGVL